MLGGTNSYSGGTDVIGGELVIASAAALASGTSLMVGNTSPFESGAEVASPADLALPADGDESSTNALDAVAVAEPTSGVLISAAGLLLCAVPFGGGGARRRAERDFSPVSDQAEAILTGGTL